MDIASSYFFFHETLACSASVFLVSEGQIRLSWFLRARKGRGEKLSPKGDPLGPYNGKRGEGEGRDTYFIPSHLNRNPSMAERQTYH